MCLAWWGTPVILELGRLRQDCQDFKASLSYTVSSKVALNCIGSWVEKSLRRKVIGVTTLGGHTGTLVLSSFFLLPRPHEVSNCSTKHSLLQSSPCYKPKTIRPSDHGLKPLNSWTRVFFPPFKLFFLGILLQQWKGNFYIFLVYYVVSKLFL